MDVPKASLDPAAFALSALRMQLYPWQIETLTAAGKGWPCVVCAPNGSGKSSVTLTAAILWFLAEFPRGRAVVTSGSWSQLKSQLFDSLRRFSNHPLFRGFEFLEASVKTPAGGYVIGLSVAEAEKIEGYHPRPEDDSPTMICIDEAKAIQDAVFESIDKCRWNFRITVSSAGPASGRFHRYFTTESDYWFRRKITFRECPHLDDRQRLADLEIYGEASAFYRNRWLSEFATDSGQAMISHDALRDCQAHPPGWQQPNLLSCGCDFAASEHGDKCVLALARGNRIEIVDSWRHANPKHSAGKFIEWFRKLGLQGHQINVDAGGLGVGYAYDLQSAGFYVKEVHNGSASSDPDRWLNLGVEYWDKFSTLVANRAVILPTGKDGEELIRQLSDRRKEYHVEKLKLESKADMRTRGASSPDLADAAILAVMNGWGALPSSLNPKAHAQTLAAMDQVTRRMERQRSEFYTPHVNFDFMR